MSVSILKQGNALIASVPASLSDADLASFRQNLVESVGRLRARGVVIDVTLADVLDSFATRTLQMIASAVHLRGARTVIVGVQPEVAFAMVQLGLELDGIATALDLEQGLSLLTERIKADDR